MNYVRLGSSGLKVTEITFGTALTIGTENCDVDYARKMISCAWENGIRSFDTSNNYGDAERLLGLALSQYNREEYVVSTKGSWPIGESVYHKGLSRKHILWAIEESLKKLNMDYLDLYYAHRYDPEVSMDEIVRTFNYLINIGKIRYWGVSEWPIEAIEECLEVCEKYGLEKPIANQFIYSYAVQKSVASGVDSYCKQKSISTLGFSPLCQGFLTGKYKNGIPENSRISKKELIKYDKTINFYNQNKEKIDFFIEQCDTYNCSYVAVAVQWCLRKKIYPVMGASNKEQLNNNVKALELKVPDELWNKLERYEEK